MLNQDKAASAAVSIETINAVVAKLSGTDRDIVARANELKQLAGNDGIVSCISADTEETHTSESSTDWTWTWPF